VGGLPRPTEAFGHLFSDPGLLEQALTHASAGGRNNERLEFLGDGLLNMIVAEALFERWPRADEGELTRARASLVRESALAELGRRLEVGRQLIFGPGELKTGAHRRDSILADAVEAIIAAVYLDAGFGPCRELVRGWFADAVEAVPAGKVLKDPKTRLQEWLQARQQLLPSYAVIEASGEDHDRHFRASCRLEDSSLQTEGAGGSRRAAEQQAAAAMLEQLQSLDAAARARRDTPRAAAPARRRRRR